MKNSFLQVNCHQCKLTNFCSSHGQCIDCLISNIRILAVSVECQNKVRKSSGIKSVRINLF